MHISIIIPIFNEEENIEILYKSLTDVLVKMGKDYEMIFVDDGSTDNSPAILKALREKDKKVRVIKFLGNFGQSAAMDSGFKSARGEFVVTIDGDNQNDPEDIPRLLDAIKNFDAVVGWRAKRQDSLLKKATSRFANFVRNKVSGETIRDTGCTLKIFRRKALEGLKMYNGMHRFLPTLLKINGFTVGEIQVNHRPRLHGESKYNTRKRMIKPLLDLLAVTWMKKYALKYKGEEIA